MKGEKFRGVLQSIISMAKHLGMHVTAEGIEIESHLNFLQAAECDYIQGYFLVNRLVLRVRHCSLKHIAYKNTAQVHPLSRV